MRPPPTRPGSALLAVTIIAAMLATAGALALTTARSARLTQSDAVRLEQARLDALSAAAAAIVALDASETLSLSNETSALIGLPEGAVVRLQDAGGLLDLNAASPQQFDAVLQALGLAPEKARALADAIADWRDPDSLRHLYGAERDDYLAAGLDPPANRAFALESELAGVLGMNAAILRCFEPLTTIEPHGGDVVSAHAPGDVRTALAIAPAPQTPFGAAPLGRLIRVTSDAPLSPSAVVRFQEWVRLSGDPDAPVMVHRALTDYAPRRQETCRIVEGGA